MALAVSVLAAAASVWLWQLRQPQSNAIMRGWLAAEQHGCFSCHGFEGRSGAKNPGSDELRIPSWDGGMLMMYVEDVSEIREWILFGSPRRLRPDAHSHADTDEPKHRGLVSMPAFEEVLSEAEVNDLIALVRKVGNYGLVQPPEATRRGRQVAQDLGCFGCHRLEGLVGTPNPGSFKGYIPAWRGPDFDELVQGEQELREWILEGRIQRLQSDPLARYFSNRQTIQMPAYRKHISPADLDSLVSYIQWVSEASLFE